MPKRKDGLNVYEDVITMMDTALIHDQDYMTFTLASSNIAIRTLQRMHQWRLRDREADPNGEMRSKYDKHIYSRDEQTIIVRRREPVKILAVRDRFGNPLDMYARQPTVAEQQRDLDAHDYAQPSNDPEVEWGVAVNRYELRRFMKARQAGYTGEQITADQSILNQFGPPCDAAPETLAAFRAAGKPHKLAGDPAPAVIDPKQRHGAQAPYDPNGPAPPISFEIIEPED